MKDLSSFLTWSKNLSAGTSALEGNTTVVDQDNTAMKAPGSVGVYAQAIPIPSKTDDPDLDLQGSPTPVTTISKPGSTIPSSGEWKKAGE